MSDLLTPAMLLEGFGLPDGAMDWQRSGTCAVERIPSAEYFPEAKGEGATYKAIDACRRCPVRLECVRFAIGTRAESGVFGAFNFGNKKARRLAGEWVNGQAGRLHAVN